MKRSEKDAALDDLYERVPKMTGCDGRCWISCGPLDMSGRERARLREAGYKITPPAEAMMRSATFWCEALTEGHRCGAYKIRPLICRIWGAAQGMQCPYGCVPEGGFLSDAEVAELFAEADRIGGDGLPLGKLPDNAADTVASAFSNGGIRLRLQHNVPAAFRPAAEEFPCPSCGFMLTWPSGDDKIGRCGHCREVIDLSQEHAVSAAPPAGRPSTARRRKKGDLKGQLADAKALRDAVIDLIGDGADSE